MKSATLIFWGFFGLALAAITCCGAEEKAKPLLTPTPSRQWPELEKAMGNVNMNGVLRLSYPLGEGKALQTLGLHCSLEHTIEVDGRGCVRSRWLITGLKTLLAPSDRQHLLWQPLFGPPVSFMRSKIGHSLNEAGASHWLIREAALNVYEIKALDGRSWRYEAGVLTSVEHPALGILKVVMRGGLLCELRATDAASDAPAWLAAKYDQAGRLESITLAGVGTHSFVWDSNGQLLTWKRAAGGQVEFEYQQGLISSIKEPDKDVKRYSWAENPGHERGDSRWRWPVHLASDEAHAYRYELSHKGFVLSCSDNASGRETVSIFNPRLHRLVQRRNGETIIVTFHGSSGNTSALQRIENDQGEILEDYQYDERGLLVGVKRKGELDRSFSYDEDGRLMALDEMPASQ